MYNNGNDMRGAGTLNASLAAKLAASETGSPVRERTVAEAMIQELESILEIMRSNVERQSLLRDRFFGAQAEDPSKDSHTPPANGQLAQIEERVNWLRTFAIKSRDLTISLERLG